MNGKQIISLVLGTTLSSCTPQEPLSNLPLQERLKAISERSAPQFESLNAMCYAVANLPSTENYHCPVCGSKTAYMTKGLIQKNGGDGRISDSWEDAVRIVSRMRGLMKEMEDMVKQNGYVLRMDESGLCAKCGKGKKPDLVLIAVNPDGKETRTEGFDEDDMVYLTAFFKGQDYYEDMGSHPLKEKAGRIAELLGLKLD